MPCCNQLMVPYYDDSQDDLRQELHDEAETTAVRLLAWLASIESSCGRGSEESATEALCESIKKIGEDRFLAVCRDRFDDPVARELAGWWEVHKRRDEKRDE